MEQKREMDLAVRGTAKMTGDGFRHAPVHIVIVGDPRVKESSDQDQAGKSRISFHHRSGECYHPFECIWRRRLSAWPRNMSAMPTRPIWKRCLRFFWKSPNRCGFIISSRSAMQSPDRRPAAKNSGGDHALRKDDLNKFRDDQGMTKFIMTRTLQGAYGRRGLGDASKG